MTRPVMFNRVKRVDKMTIAGSISNNTFRLEPKSYSDHDSTLWLSPEFIDFGKDVVIKQRSSFKGPVKPSAEVLLNDVLRRADREHPFWSKLEFKQKNWQPQPTNLK